MPLYEYSCRKGHTTELRRGIEDSFISCPLCGEIAQRESIYLSQSIVTETGSKPHRIAEVPREERNYRNQYRQFQEATAELDYQHTKVEKEVGVTLPSKSLWKKGIEKAKRIKAGVEAPLKKVR